MKKPKDHLWQLIQGLSPADKRYFRQHFAPEEGLLLRLYERLNAQAAYDEAEARQAIGCAPAVYKVLKAQLYELLLLSLRAGRDRHNAAAKLCAAIAEFDLLFERRLYDLALDRIRKAKALCLAHESYAFMLEVIQREYMVTQLFDDSYQLSEAPFWADWAFAMERQWARYNLQRQAQQWMDVQKRPELQPEADYWQEKTAELEALPAAGLGMRAQLSWLSAMQVLAAFRGDRRQSAALKEQAVQLMESDDRFVAENPMLYLGALRNQANTLAAQQRKDLLDKAIHKAERVTRLQPAYEPYLLHFYFARLMLYNGQQHWGEVEEEFRLRCRPLIERCALRHTRVAGLSMTMAAVACLNLSQYNRALELLLLFRESAPRVEPHIAMAGALLELIICWETEAYDRLNEQLRRARKWSPAQGSPLFALHLRLVEQLIRQPFEAAAMAAELLVALPDYYQDSFFGIYTEIGLERWLQALATRRKITDVLKQRPGL